MAMATNRELIDRLKQMTTEERDALRRASNAAAAPGNPLGLKYVVNARVIDVVSGQRAVVLRTSRDSQTNAEAFSVRLSDGRLVIRHGDELEPDPEPAQVQA